MTRIGVSAGFSSSNLPPPAQPPQVMNLPLPAWRSAAPRRAALLRSSLPPPPAGSRYYCIQQHKSDRTNSGRQRRRAARATFVAPANREEPSYSYFAGCQPIKNDLKFSWPSHRKKMKSIILMMIFFCGICTYLVYIEQAERREYTTVQSIVVQTRLQY